MSVKFRNQVMNRRNFARGMGSAFALAALAPTTSTLASLRTPKRLGVSIASYGARWRYSGDEKGLRWENALDVLDHCADLGAGCLQIGVGGWTDGFAGKARAKREALEIVLEGQIGLPRSPEAVSRFDAELRAAQEAGATTLRTVCLGGRRYETFNSMEEWRAFVSESVAALERAEPVLAKRRIRLAVENHKDWRAEEQLALLRRLDSEWIGVNFDFGNNVALLEDPHAVADALAPYMMSTHLKDMAVSEYEDGFLLSEVPLGEGILDLPRLIRVCASKNPRIEFNLEMITRDPLRIPVLEDKYWKTMSDGSAAYLAQLLKLSRGRQQSLPTVKTRSAQERIEFEERNVRDSFGYARRQLGFV